MEASSLERGASQGPDNGEYITIYTDQGTTTTCTPVGDYRGDDITTDMFLTGLRVAGYDEKTVESGVGKGRNIFDISFHRPLEAGKFRAKYGEKGDNLVIGKHLYRVAPAQPLAKSIRKPWTAVFVSGVAVCISDESVTNRLKQYADVKAIYRLTHKNFPKIQNGTRKVMVTNFKRELPERLNIEGCRAWVALKGETKCFRCGKKGHIARKCPIYDDAKALAAESTWGQRDKLTVNKTLSPRRLSETDYPLISSPPIDQSPTEATMQFIDSRHELILPQSPESQLSHMSPEGSTWDSHDPTIPTDSNLDSNPDQETEWGGMNLDDSWCGEWPGSPISPMSPLREEKVWKDATAGPDPERADPGERSSTPDLFRTYSPGPIEEENHEPVPEEGEIVSDSPRTPEPVFSPQGETAAGGAGMGGNSTDDGEYYSLVETPKPAEKIKHKPKFKTKSKRKRPEENSGDRKSSELKRKTMSRTEVEKIVDKNIRQILEGRKSKIS